MTPEMQKLMEEFDKEIRRVVPPEEEHYFYDNRPPDIDGNIPEKSEYEEDVLEPLKEFVAKNFIPRSEVERLCEESRISFPDFQKEDNRGQEAMRLAWNQALQDLLDKIKKC